MTHQNWKQLFIIQCRSAEQCKSSLHSWHKCSPDLSAYPALNSQWSCHTHTLKAWKNVEQFKAWMSPDWDDSQNIYKGAGRHLLHLRKAFPSLWGGVSFLSTLFISSMHLEEAKCCYSLGQRQIALYLKDLVTLFSVWLASQSNPESSWQSLPGNQSEL